MALVGRRPTGPAAYDSWSVGSLDQGIFVASEGDAEEAELVVSLGPMPALAAAACGYPAVAFCTVGALDAQTRRLRSYRLLVLIDATPEGDAFFRRLDQHLPDRYATNCRKILATDGTWCRSLARRKLDAVREGMHPTPKRVTGPLGEFPARANWGWSHPNRFGDVPYFNSGVHDNEPG